MQEMRKQKSWCEITLMRKISKKEKRGGGHPLNLVTKTQSSKGGGEEDDIPGIKLLQMLGWWEFQMPVSHIYPLFGS